MSSPFPDLLGGIHGRLVHPRRLRVLADLLARSIPEASRVLDVGAGDGRLARRLLEARPDLTLAGVDVKVRRECAIPVEEYDGTSLPWPDGAFDDVMLIDVLHHAEDPETMMREAVRVARRGLVIKDHLRQGVLAGTTLAFMDRVGNLRHGVAMTYDYWTPERWRATFDRLGLEGKWETRLELYPRPLRPIFERSLHYFVRFEVSASREAESATGRPGGPTRSRQARLSG